MKNILILTVVLTPLLSFSQIINITPEQEQKINDIVTPENLIEWSKGLSNEKRQKIIIDSLQLNVKELKSITKTFYTENQFSLLKIDSLNTKIKDDTQLHENALKDQTNLFKKQIKKERLKIGGISLLVLITLFVVK